MGVREQIEPFARRVVRDHLPEQHREFYAQLPFVVVAARDAAARPWVTLLAALGGVASSPDPHTLDFRASPAPGDALHDTLRPGADVGVLGIEFHTRRRNRVNGRIEEHGVGDLRLRVEQSFGNCPQYIVGRDWEPAISAQLPRVERGQHLNDRQRAWVARADTFFVASGFRAAGEQAAYGMDASHRGGPAGFVRVLDERTLAWPDYAGNNHYNTLGNLVMDARIGLLFVDFASGSLLQLTGSANVQWTPAPSQWPGAQRVIEVTIEAVIERTGVLPIRWLVPPALELAVDEVTQETADVKSFWLVHAHGDALPEFSAGQHLPVIVDIDGVGESRQYSLSSSPQDSRWRITVKRHPDGRVSSYLHDRIGVGARLEAGLPSGGFTAKDAPSPLVLIGAGIGITPLVSMLADSAARARDVHFLQAARHAAQTPLRGELEALARLPHVKLHRIFSQAHAADVDRRQFDHAGRLSPALLQSLLPSAPCDVYLCGPASFVADITAWLLEHGIPHARIHSESFG